MRYMYYKLSHIDLLDLSLRLCIKPKTPANGPRKQKKINYIFHMLTYLMDRTKIELCSFLTLRLPFFLIDFFPIILIQIINNE